MATYSGRNARVTLGDGATEKIIMELGTWKVSMKANEVDTSAFGDGWGKSDVGIMNWSGSLDGNYDPKDADGQAVLEAAFKSGQLIQDIKFYLKHQATGEVVFFEPDTVSDANAGVRITALDVSVDKAGVGKISATFSGSGPCKKTIETRP
ncbi:hypothetical protein NNJEOMEG_03309 [Fundidesulfovibrio magnetotacticus]|uniref:Phage major tail protein 2 n=1 Tax=Fundidesulfovibrio magnetotacticus TaxID=2730080 RepID=A0A6V8M087_9BACT|nr:hypothetical protein [Fundidesulfovibrio magnetotacticus]GFK95446.1 hypothetical protein NNJEOMEG_03309 [Fundidesulfovibrio magnetotacticus]